jgi:hypothetical protein
MEDPSLQRHPEWPGSLRCERKHRHFVTRRNASIVRLTLAFAVVACRLLLSAGRGFAAYSPPADLVTAPEPLRTALRGGTWLRQARACAALTAQPSDPVEYRATVRALRATAERALAAHQEATQLGKELGTLARAVASALLAQRGVGPVTGAQVLISWSHPGGCARRPPLPCWPAPPPSRPPPGGWFAIGSTAAVTAS